MIMNFLYELPTHSRAGGVGVFVKRGYNPVVRNDIKASNGDCTTFEDIWIKISINRIKYYIGGYYRHPNTSIKEFKDCLETTLDKVKHKKRVIFCGDMNNNLNNYNCDKSTTDYINAIIGYYFWPYTLLPITITSYCATTIIDHV